MGWADGQTNGQMNIGANEDGDADRRTGANSRRIGGRADRGRHARRTSCTDEGRQAGQAGGQEWMGWRMGGWCRTDCPKAKLSQLMHQLTWPLEIQCIRRWISVKKSHLPPSSW